MTFLAAAPAALATTRGTERATNEAGASQGLVTARTTATSFCAGLPASKVSSTTGTKVSLLEATVEKTSLECIYEGTAEIIISKRPGMSSSDLSTLSKAEQYFNSESPKGVKIAFTALPSVGSTAFSWTYTLNGGKLLGVSDNKGTTGYGDVIGGAPDLITTSKYLTDLEKLLSLDIAG